MRRRSVNIQHQMMRILLLKTAIITYLSLNTRQGIYEIRRNSNHLTHNNITNIPFIRWQPFGEFKFLTKEFSTYSIHLISRQWRQEALLHHTYSTYYGREDFQQLFGNWQSSLNKLIHCDLRGWAARQRHSNNIHAITKYVYSNTITNRLQGNSILSFTNTRIKLLNLVWKHLKLKKALKTFPQIIFSSTVLRKISKNANLIL